MKFTPAQVITLAALLIASTAVLVGLRVLPPEALATPALMFFAWLAKSPLPPSPVPPVVVVTPPAQNDPEHQ